MKKETKDIRIFVSHRIDLRSKAIDNDIFYPVRCGAILDEHDNPLLPGDDTGDNISSHRERLCELTVLYWAWKNVKDADYYGLCHYRRYMNFSTECFPEDNYGNVIFNHLGDEAIRHLQLDNPDAIRKAMNDVDYAYTDFDVTKVGYKNVYEQYIKASPTLKQEEIDLAIQLIKERTPEFEPYAQQFFMGQHFYPCLMFVMRKDIFQQFCEWMFPLAFELERKLENSHRSLEARRNPAHVVERLLGVFLTYLMESRPELKGKKFQRTVFLNTDYQEDLKPAFSKQNIPVVLNASDYYVPYLAVTLRSILEHAQPQNYYDFIVLHTSIQKNSREKLQQDLKDFSNWSLRFFDVSPWLTGVEFQKNLAHYSLETFYRLLIPKIFKNYHKLVYLDSDVIVRTDLSELYDTDLADAAVGAALDVDFIGEYNGAIPYIKSYCDEVLQLVDPYQYFQAGVMLFNVDKMRQMDPNPMALIALANHKNYKYADQDILNVHYHQSVKYFDLSWNVLTDCYGIRLKDIISAGPADYYKAYIEARKHPKIIHYAGGEKPWNVPLMDFGPEYFKYARKSLFYEEILVRMNFARQRPMMVTLSFARRVADKIFPKGTRRRAWIKRRIPRGSPQWEFLKRIYHKIF